MLVGTVVCRDVLPEQFYNTFTNHATRLFGRLLVFDFSGEEIRYRPDFSE